MDRKAFTKAAVISVVSFLLAGTMLYWVTRMRATEPDQRGLPVYWEAPDFELNNTAGEKISRRDLEGKISVVDFIFTRCPGPCPLMTQKMRGLQQALSGVPRLQLVSISVDPAYDNPDVLKAYAESWKADLSNWHFLTGPEEETLRMIVKGFKVAADNPLGDNPPEDVIHGTNFLLVDEQGQIRGVYDYDDGQLVEKITADIQQLRN